MKRFLLTGLVLLVLVTSLLGLNLGKQKQWCLVVPTTGCVLEVDLYQKFMALYQEAHIRMACPEFLVELQALLAQFAPVPGMAVFSQDFSDSLDHWTFYRKGSQANWDYENSGGNRYLHLSLQGPDMMEAERIIAVPGGLEGKAILVSANIQANLFDDGSAPNQNFSAAGLVVQLFKEPVAQNSFPRPDYGKAQLWTTSRYPLSLSPYRYDNEVITYLEEGTLNTLQPLSVVFYPDVTSGVQYIKVGLTALCSGSNNRAELWVSDVQVNIVPAVLQ
ncbi:MAG TPA: hypothetical protein P5560_03830 [Thermotogota bacterium]|nr:hypothetical protein [Thermotogota bacterium]HRW92060.1 hypothetical protein [Thermotogota bacterium]